RAGKRARLRVPVSHLRLPCGGRRLADRRRRRSRADVARGLGRFGLVRLARIARAPVLRVGAPVLFLLGVTAVVLAVRSSLVRSQAAVLVRVPPARHALARTHPAPALLGKYTIVRSGDTLGG